MQTLFFPDYIKSNMFIEDLQKELVDKDIYFDLILSDISYTSCPILLISPENKPNQTSLIESRQDALQTAKHPIIILDQLNIEYIKPILNSLGENLTIINLSTGMGSIGKKLSPEFEDLNATGDFNCYEPIDLENFWNILKKSGLNYIRLPYRELPDAIFDVDELGIIDASMLKTLDTISLRTYGFRGSNGTIFTSGSMFSLAIQTGELLQDEGKDCSFFIFQKLNSEWNEEMIESIKKSKNLTILIDHKNSKELKGYIHGKMNNYKLKDIKLKIISPIYTNLTTFFEEYQDEQAQINPETLTKRILN